MEPGWTVGLRTPQPDCRPGPHTSWLSEAARPKANGLVCSRRWKHGIHARTKIYGQFSSTEKRLRPLRDQCLVYCCNSNSSGGMAIPSQRSCGVRPEDVVYGVRASGSKL